MRIITELLIGDLFQILYHNHDEIVIKEDFICVKAYDPNSGRKIDFYITEIDAQVVINYIYYKRVKCLHDHRKRTKEFTKKMEIDLADPKCSKKVKDWILNELKHQKPACSDFPISS